MAVVTDQAPALDAEEGSGCFLIQESGDAEEELPLPDVQLEEH